MDSGEIASVVAIVGMIFTGLGISGIDAGVLTGAVNGIFSFITICAAVWSWWSHRSKNAQIATGVR